MIGICQEKLVEIKEQEARVSRLQLELERIHANPRLTAADLRKANDAFEEFAKVSTPPPLQETLDVALL